MSDNGDLREDLKIPDGEIGQQLKTEYDAGKELLVSNYLVINKQFLLHNTSNKNPIRFIYKRTNLLCH